MAEPEIAEKRSGKLRCYIGALTQTGIDHDDRQFFRSLKQIANVESLPGALLQLKVRLSKLAVLALATVFGVSTVASAKTADPKIKR